MLSADTLFWDWFEAWSPWSFLAAGGLWVLTAIFSWLPSSLPTAGAILVTHLSALTLGVSLVGLYPRLRDHGPRLSLGGVVCIGFTMVALVVFPIALVGVAIPLGAPAARLSEIGLAGGAFSVVAYVFLTPLGSLLLGAASLRTQALPESLGYLLFGLAVPWLVLVAHALVSTPTPPNWVLWLVVAGLALAIGYVLHPRSEPRGRATTQL